MRRCICSLYACLTFFLLLVGSGELAAKSSAIATHYDFSTRMGWETLLVVFRNEKKIRPLYLTGHPGKGELEFRPKGMASAEKVGGIGMDAFEGLMEYAVSQGVFQVDVRSVHVSRVNADEYPGSEWLKKDQMPRIYFQINAIRDWKPDEKSKNLKPDSRGILPPMQFDAQCDLSIVVGDKKCDLKDIPFRINQGSSSISFSSKFAFRGEHLGLSGDDTGDLSCEILFNGYTTHKKITKELLDKAVESTVIGD